MNAAASLTVLLASFGLAFKDARSFQVKTVRTKSEWSADTAVRALAARGAETLRLEALPDVDAAEAARRTQEQFLRLALLYSGDAAYPGVLTKKIDVPAGLKPRFVTPGPAGWKTAVLYATAAFTYGAGAQDLVAYRALLSFRYCPQRRTLTRVELFFPKGSFDEKAALAELGRLRCAPGPGSVYLPNLGKAAN